jgi:hypothetical protein
MSKAIATHLYPNNQGVLLDDGQQGLSPLPAFFAA